MCNKNAGHSVSKLASYCLQSCIFRRHICLRMCFCWSVKQMGLLIYINLQNQKIFIKSSKNANWVFFQANSKYNGVSSLLFPHSSKLNLIFVSTITMVLLFPKIHKYFYLSHAQRLAENLFCKIQILSWKFLLLDVFMVSLYIWKTTQSPSLNPVKS